MLRTMVGFLDQRRCQGRGDATGAEPPRARRLMLPLFLVAALAFCLGANALGRTAQADPGQTDPGQAALGRPTLTALKPIVLDVRIGRHPDKTRFVLEVTDIVDYTLLPLADPERMVIDLPALDWRSDDQAGRGVGLIARYRSGQFDPATTRIVLELTGPAIVKDQFFLPAKDRHLPRFVLDLAAVSATRFAATVGTPIPASGRRAPAGVAAAPAPAETSPTDGHAADAARRSAPDRADVSAPKALVPAPQPRSKPTETALAAAPATPRPRALPSGPPLVPPRRPDRWLVVVDPGHGGIDPGAIGVDGVHEKDITLAMARDLRDVLQRTGRFKVRLTRSDDRFLRLRERVEVARRLKADLFLSLHADSIGLSNFRGVSVYTLSETASDREAEMLAAKENRADALAGIDLSREQDEVVSILIDLAQRDALNQARRFAQLVVDGLPGVAPLIPRPHRSAGFAVLTAPDVPSVLIELGYLTNQKDAVLLQQTDYRRKLAQALTESVTRFFETLATAQRL